MHSLDNYFYNCLFIEIPLELLYKLDYDVSFGGSKVNLETNVHCIYTSFNANTQNKH